MRPAKLTCPHAQYAQQMAILCTKSGDLCAHQRYCQYKGWSVLTDQAETCPARKEESNGKKRKTAAKRRN